MKYFVVVIYVFSVLISPLRSQEYLIHETTGLYTRILADGNKAILLFENEYNNSYIYSVGDTTVEIPTIDKFYYRDINKQQLGDDLSFFKLIEPFDVDIDGYGSLLVDIKGDSVEVNDFYNLNEDYELFTDVGIYKGQFYITYYNKLYRLNQDLTKTYIDSTESNISIYNYTDSTFYLRYDGHIHLIDDDFQSLKSVPEGIIINNYYDEELWVIRGEELVVYGAEDLEFKRSMTLGDYLYYGYPKESHRMEAAPDKELWYIDSERNILSFNTETGEHKNILMNQEVLEDYQDDFFIEDFSRISDDEIYVSFLVVSEGKPLVYHQKRKIGEDFKEHYIDISFDRMDLTRLSGSEDDFVFEGEISNQSTDTIYTFSIYDSSVHMIDIRVSL